MIRLWMKAGLMAWVLGASPELLRAQECGTCNTGIPCATPFSCASHHCGPPYRHCAEGPPNLKIKIGCPKPICNPCTQPNMGYYETCWSPWPWGNATAHCRPPVVAMNGFNGHTANGHPSYGHPGVYPNGGHPQAVQPNGGHPNGALPYANGTPEYNNPAPAPAPQPQGFAPPAPMAVPANPNAPAIPQAIPQQPQRNF